MPLVPLRAQRRSLPLEHCVLLFLAALVLASTVLTISQSSVAEAARRLGAPRPLSPGDRSTQRTVPAFSWARVKRAATYEFQLSADRRFKSARAICRANESKVRASSISRCSCQGRSARRSSPISAPK